MITLFPAESDMHSIPISLNELSRYQLYLRSAIDLEGQNQYLPALAILRTALEHQLTDRLLFLATRYKQVFHEVPKRVYQQWLRDMKRRKQGTEDIIQLKWNSGTMIVIRSGPHESDGRKRVRRPSISIYYFLLKDFDPFVGTPQEQKHLARGFDSLTDWVDHATQQQRIYGSSLRWEGIKDNLLYNRLCSAETLRRLQVHYRFLSAYVHPIPHAFDEIYGRNRPSGAPRYDHYASELILLYIIKIASEELKALKKMAWRPPRIRLADWEAVEGRIRTADALAEQLWFPGGRPHRFDYVEEANSRGVRGNRILGADQRVAPHELKASQLRYYRNPLRRLVKMHSSFREVTGFSYVSPWERADAFYR